MSKIILKKVYLLNWYGFVDKTIPMGKSLTLMTGENECGKSTVLDAIKYAFNGDVVFNKGTGAKKIGDGERTLSTYTRCLIDPENRKFARPSNSYPNVYSHISLEYHNELYNSDFVLGVILETDSSDNVDNYWYSKEKATLNDMAFFDNSDGKKYVLNAKEFRDKNNVELMNKNNGTIKFMTMVGLKLSADGIKKYQRKLRSIMTYNPEAKIQQFIKDSVLEDKFININKLKEAKSSIDEITASFDSLEKEINDLDEILQAFNSYAKVKSRLVKDDAKIVYKDILNTKRKIETNNNKINENTFEIDRISELLKIEKSQKEQKEIDLRNAKYQFNQMDGTKAIQDEKDILNRLVTKNNEIYGRLKELNNLIDSLQEFINEQNLNYKFSDFKSIVIPSAVKNNELNEFIKIIDELFDQLNSEKVQINNSLSEVQKKIIELDNTIKTCERNLPDFSDVKNQSKLIMEINNRFNEMGIKSQAKFSCSYVIELKNEDWRNSIECFLGIHRYSIIVEPEYFDIANEVMDNSQYKYVELVNTKLLRNKKFRVEDDSLLNQLEIKNDTAYQYFAYWLGRIHAVDIKDVPNFENAISKEGKISRNMAVTFLNFGKLNSYCLGEDANQLNVTKAKKEREIFKEKEKSYLEGKNSINSKIISTKAIMQIVSKNYDLDSPKKYNDNDLEIAQSKERIKKLDEALKNNREYLLLSERITALENEVNTIDNSITDNSENKMQLISDRETNARINNDLTIKLSDYKEKYAEMNINNPLEVHDAEAEYNDYVDGKRDTGNVMIPQTRERAQTEKGTCERSITNRQSVYNNGKHSDELLPIGLDCEANYRGRKNKLQVDSLEDIKTKLFSQTRKYELIFKNEFVLKIKTNVEEAQADIKEINKQLKKLKFSTTYQFDVKEITGVSDYAKILEYASYLKKINRIDDNQMILSSVVGYDENEASNREKEMKEIINRIISSNNNDMLNDFADYRNYMDYEVIVNNDEITNGRLSKLAGYDSGAGTQIPYMIILAASLSMIYNARQNSTKLVFIDEPFEKMSDKNIKIMLEFFKTQDFQVIFCAPPNKLDSIGKECSVVIPIKRITKSNMTLGAIKFYD